MTTIPSRACAPLTSAIRATTTAVAVIQQVREIPVATAQVRTAVAIIPDLRRMEARPALTAAPAAAITTTTEAPDRQSRSRPLDSVLIALGGGGLFGGRSGAALCGANIDLAKCPA
jgi:hypothetical protein